MYFYDGNELEHLTVEDGLISNEIIGIQEDTNGNIFIETRSGVTKYDGLSYSNLIIKDDKASRNKWVLNEDDLWFRLGFNKRGVYRYDGEYLHYLEFFKAPQEDDFYKNHPGTSFSPYGVYSIYKDRKGLIWFGTTSLGVCRFDGKLLSWHYEEQLQTTPGGGDFGSRVIFEDKNANFWINNTRYRYNILSNDSDHIALKKETGISYKNKDNEEEFPFFLGMEQDDDGNLWMVTYRDGVWRYDGKKLTNYVIKDGETEVEFFTIYKDNKGAMWLGTHNAGVYTYDGESFKKMTF